MLSVFGLTDVIGRISFGVIANLNKIAPVYLRRFAALTVGVAQLCLTWAKTTPIVYLFLIVIGVNGGKLDVPQKALTVSETFSLFRNSKSAKSDRSA